VAARSGSTSMAISSAPPATSLRTLVTESMLESSSETRPAASRRSPSLPPVMVACSSPWGGPFERISAWKTALAVELAPAVAYAVQNGAGVGVLGDGDERLGLVVRTDG
jgi:hypothetical protein